MWFFIFFIQDCKIQHESICVTTYKYDKKRNLQLTTKLWITTPHNFCAICSYLVSVPDSLVLLLVLQLFVLISKVDIDCVCKLTWFVFTNRCVNNTHVGHPKYEQMFRKLYKHIQVCFFCIRKFEKTLKHRSDRVLPQFTEDLWRKCCFIHNLLTFLFLDTKSAMKSRII